MNIGVDYGSGERTMLFVQPAKKGKVFRAVALQSALRELGKAASIDYCFLVISSDGIVDFNELPDTH
ncbi:MAG: hypothetical protein ACPGGK_13065 [Pikeienuella sp.]